MKKIINWKILSRVLIVIDAANLEHSAKDLSCRIRYAKLKKFFDINCSLTQIIFYSAKFNTESHNRFLTFLKLKKFKLVTKPIKIIQDINDGEKRKANFDVEITADVLSKLEHFDTLILFSGDSDFNYLIKLIKNKGKKVIVVSSRYHISKELVLSSTRYVDLKNFKGIFLIKQKSPSFSTGS